MTVRQAIADALERAAREIGAEGELPDLELTRTRNPVHGDFASSAGLKLARILKRSPNQIAEELRAQYRLGYTPAQEAATTGYHRIDLSLHQKGLLIQTRDGYYTGK